MQARTPLAIAIVAAVALLTVFLVTPIGVLVSNVLIGSEENIDFVPGNNMTITAVADPTNDVVRVTFNAATSTATSTAGIGAFITQENDVTVVSSTTVLDFNTGLDVVSGPANEANVSVDPDEFPLASDEIWIGLSGLASSSALVDCNATTNRLQYTTSTNTISCDTTDVIEETELDTKAELETQITDVADFAEADGDIYTGTHDFGGATTELENSSGCGVAADGQICINTAATSSALIYQSNGVEHVLWATSSKGIFYESATSTDDFTIWRFNRTATLTEVCYLAEGGTWVGQLQEYDSDGDSPADTQASDTTAVAGTTNCNGSFSNAVIDDGDWIGIKTTTAATNTNMRIVWEFKWAR